MEVSSFEKLKGDRARQHSMRLNDQWRLILEFEGAAPDETVVIVSIEDSSERVPLIMRKPLKFSRQGISVEKNWKLAIGHKATLRPSLPDRSAC